MLPLLSSSNEMESFVDVDTTMATPLTSELVEKIVDEFLVLKNSMNSVELQLYEANEKIAELIENVSETNKQEKLITSNNKQLLIAGYLLNNNLLFVFQISPPHQQHHLDEENEALRTENTNLTKVAKLLTENMKESVETSKK